MVARAASDLYVNAGAPPTIKVNGQFHALSGPALDADYTQALVDALLSDPQRQQLAQDLGLDFGLAFPGIGRFRVNVYYQKGTLALVVRYIKDEIPSIPELGLPDVLHDLAMAERGLVLVVGATGTGKSTTLAAMIDYRNTHRAGHILTIEDPIEYTHHHKQSLVSQREIGIDTHSYADALRFGLREAPDVIMIGEIRDSETARQAVRYAETGHLCLATMHATNANQALDRFLNCFAVQEQARVRQDLSQYLLGVLSQRVAQGVGGERVTPVEVMLNTPYIAELIEKGKHDQLKDAMSSGDDANCQTFDDSLYQLITSGRITRAEGLRLADSRIDLALRFKMAGADTGARYLSPQKHWLSKTARFENYRRVSVQVHRGSQARRPDMSAVLQEAIAQGVRERGYRLVAQSPDLVVTFAFGLCNAHVLGAPDELDVGAPATDTAEGRLVVQAKDHATGDVVWHLVAKRAVGGQQASQQEINIEVANLMSSLPLAR